MRPEYYADEYRRYQSFCKNFSGNELFKIACGPSGGDYSWTDKLMSLALLIDTRRQLEQKRLRDGIYGRKILRHDKRDPLYR